MIERMSDLPLIRDRMKPSSGEKFTVRSFFMSEISTGTQSGRTPASAIWPRISSSFCWITSRRSRLSGSRLDAARRWRRAASKSPFFRCTIARPTNASPLAAAAASPDAWLPASRSRTLGRTIFSWPSTSFRCSTWHTKNSLEWVWRQMSSMLRSSSTASSTPRQPRSSSSSSSRGPTATGTHCGDGITSFMARAWSMRRMPSMMSPVMLADIGTRS